MELLDENRVSVEIVDYPDHVSIVFFPSRQSRIQIQEFRRYVRVQFETYLVRPELPAVKPNPMIVEDVRFNSAETFGSFEILKGSKVR